MKQKISLLIMSILLLTNVEAQISHGGRPANWNNKNSNDFAVEYISTPDLDLETIKAEDEVTDQYKETPYRFGFDHEVSINTENAGSWTDLENGDRIWRLGIDCPDATSISLVFDNYKIPKGGKVFIWNSDRTDFIGSYTHLNNKDFGSFAVGLIKTSSAVVEFYLPENAGDNWELSIGQITHGYRPIVNKYESERGPFGNSGACNINVNCPEGDEWGVEKRAVALIVSGGFAVCSGTLVNNTSNDGTPYFLTANHCLGGENNWVFYFNHESANCVGSTGPTDQSVSGSELKASNGGSDFGLLLLSEDPPASFNVNFAGWDNSDAETVTSATGIHHPSGDVKKICHENDEPYHTDQFGAAVWFIDQWEDGVTEGGSSGSGLFDQNHRIIGQMYGGYAACSGENNNGLADWYGRFGVSWDGSSASTRLKDWLDPTNTGQSILDGYPDGFEVLDLDAGMNPITGVDDMVCGSTISPTVIIKNYGENTLTSATIEYQLNSGSVQSIDWTGSLETYEDEEIDLPSMSIEDGDNTLTVWISDANGVNDDNDNNNEVSLEFTALTGPSADVTIELTLDEYGSETTWEIISGGVVIYSGGPYADDVDQTVEISFVCLAETCYDFVIYDEFGDGMCCGYGDGGYQVFDGTGEVLAEGGEFDDSETTEICPSVSVEEYEEQNTLIVYPNPSNGMFIIESEQALNDPRLIVIRNTLGAMVFATELTSSTPRKEIDLRKYPKGIYFMEMNSEKNNQVQKIIIK